MDQRRRKHTTPRSNTRQPASEWTPPPAWSIAARWPSDRPLDEEGLRSVAGAFLMQGQMEEARGLHRSDITLALGALQQAHKRLQEASEAHGRVRAAEIEHLPPEAAASIGGGIVAVMAEQVGQLAAGYRRQYGAAVQPGPRPKAKNVARRLMAEFIVARVREQGVRSGVSPEILERQGLEEAARACVLTGLDQGPIAGVVKRIERALGHRFPAGVKLSVERDPNVKGSKDVDRATNRQPETPEVSPNGRQTC